MTDPRCAWPCPCILACAARSNHTTVRKKTVLLLL